MLPACGPLEGELTGVLPESLCKPAFDQLSLLSSALCWPWKKPLKAKTWSLEFHYPAAQPSLKGNNKIKSVFEGQWESCSNASQVEIEEAAPESGCLPQEAWRMPSSLSEGSFRGQHTVGFSCPYGVMREKWCMAFSWWVHFASQQVPTSSVLPVGARSRARRHLLKSEVCRH